MFFNKKQEQVALSAAEETLEWPMPGRRSQSFHIIISSWFLKTTPLLKYPHGGCKVELSFEGRARLGTTPSVPVSGDIEIPIDLDPPGYLSDRWETVPECVDGHASMHMDGPPQLFVTLFATREAMEWVSRTLVAGFSSADGRAAMDLDVTFPGPMGPEFWTEEWQTKTLQVARWDMRVSAGQSRE